MQQEEGWRESLNRFIITKIKLSMYIKNILWNLNDFFLYLILPMYNPLVILQINVKNFLYTDKFGI